jgi:HK97 gp10 family phage protein
MNITVNVAGLKGVEDALAQAGPKLAKRALRKGLDVAGDIFVDAAKAHAPVMKKGTPQRRPGELRDSIKKKTKLSAKQESGTTIVGPEYKKEDGKQSPGVWGFLVEYGLHGPTQPFMRPGFDEANKAALDAFTAEMRAGVDSIKS